jgi:hypothetical protein
MSLNVKPSSDYHAGAAGDQVRIVSRGADGGGQTLADGFFDTGSARGLASYIFP